MPVRIYDDTNALHILGEHLFNYEPHMNAFMGTMVNRIGMVIFTSKTWSNPWSFLKKGRLEFGDTIEEYFVNVAKPYSYNPEESEQKWMARVKPDIRVAFHYLNYQKYYKATIQENDFRQAFLSWQGIDQLKSQIIQSLYEGANLDEFTVMKYYMCREYLNGSLYRVNVDASDITDTIERAREYSSLLTFNKNKYNRGGVYNHTPRDDQYVFIPAAVRANVDVNVLASAFNMDKTEFIGHIVDVDSFTDHDYERLDELFGDDEDYAHFTNDELAALAAVKIIVIDKDFMQIYDALEKMTMSPYNNQGLYQNSTLHEWKVYSTSPYQNAIAFTTAAIGTATIAIAPTTKTMGVGEEADFVATVTSATAGYDKGVVYWLTGNESNDTMINPNNGHVIISPNETATTIVVHAMSVADNTKQATATITVE